MPERLPHARRLPAPQPGQSFVGSEDRCQQSFKDECDINLILGRHNTTPPPGAPGRAARAPMFGDFTNAPDFMEAQNLVIQARERFSALPVKVRDRFNHDPLRLLQFIADPANAKEAAKLGLLSAEATVRHDPPPVPAAETPK